MKFLAARRRNPLVALGLLLAALVAVGGGYAAIANVQPAQASASSQTQVEEGKKLYLAGCSSCHGMEAQGSANGPTLIGVGAAAVDFQVSTGRMPMAAPGAQAVAKANTYTQEQVAALAAYVASLAPGPAIPTAEQIDFEGADVAQGGVLFRTNCAQCHQAAGQGGALTQGKYAPNLMQATPTEIYEAMITGPQNMPVFSDGTLPVDDKKKILAYIDDLQNASSPGGLDLGRLGPVTEGLFLWTAVFAALIGAAIWIGIKAR
ncbi:MAG: c-type cytochrome [Candidatus Nanopelagicales bacterium]|nr:c-type cytochrome [Candidatus Nanopelagicales bacterium]